MTPESNSLLFAILGGFLTALLVLPRSVAWIARVVETSRAGRDGARPQPLALLTVVFLHSGPWLLTVTAGVMFGIYSYATPIVSRGFFGGLGVGSLLIGLGLLVAYRVRSTRVPPPPLTAERLRRLKRRFMVRNTFILGTLMTVGSLYFLWNTFPRTFLMISIPIASFIWGLVMAFFAWQFEWAFLGESDYLRRQAEKDNPPE